MIDIDTRLFIIETAISRLFFFFIFFSFYKSKSIFRIKKYGLNFLLYILLLCIDYFLNPFFTIIFILIMYIMLKEKKNTDYYLLNSIILSLLIEFVSSIIVSVTVSKVNNLYSLGDLCQ